MTQSGYSNVSYSVNKNIEFSFSPHDRKLNEPLKLRLPQTYPAYHMSMAMTRVASAIINISLRHLTVNP